MKNFNVIDLFSGCGGLSYGFEMAGYKILLGVDKLQVALDTFKLNHKNSDILNADISKLSAKEILDKVGSKPIDLIIGGPPCQGFSLSGPRNFYDPRNKFYLSFIKLVKEIKPKAFLIENVPGIISLYKGQVKYNILSIFSEIGYKINYDKLNAAAYGVPQMRYRVFFVGLYQSKNYFVFPDPVLSPSRYIKLKEAISDLPPLENKLGENFMEYPPNRKLSDYQRFCRKGSEKIYNHLATDHTPKTKHIISLVPEGGNYKYLPEKYSKTRNFHVAWTRFNGERPAPTIDTGHRHHFHYKYNRIPTVRESARIQSFPDSFVFLGNKTQQYLQVGNAVPPLLGYAIAKELKKYL